MEKVELANGSIAMTNSGENQEIDNSWKPALFLKDYVELINVRRVVCLISHWSETYSHKDSLF